MPTVRPSLPEEDIIGLHHTISHLNTQGLVPASQCFSLRVQPTPQADQTPHPTRRFLLTKDSIHYSRTVKTAVPLNHRNQYPRLEGLAIVSERKKDHLEALESHVGIQPELDRLPPQVQETRSERQRPLKHPGVYHEGRQRRQDDRKKTKHHPIAECGEDLVAIQREYDSLKLARELQLFALEQTIDDGDFKRIHERAQDIQSLIGQHKAHPQRYSHGHKLATDSGGRPAGADIVMQDDEDEYITETYVRQDGTNIANATSLKDEGSTRSSINTGLIVITDDVEDVWEDFGQDEVSDGGYTSDEEDENGTSLNLGRPSLTLLQLKTTTLMTTRMTRLIQTMGMRHALTYTDVGLLMTRNMMRRLCLIRMKTRATHGSIKLGIEI